MAVFDSYLPPDGPLRLVGGEAALTADLTLLPEDAGGNLRLASGEVLATFAGQQLRADLTLNARLSGGRPADMSVHCRFHGDH